ncbi:nicotinate-nucleotide--dimethylbenzimidazole phosphoribosyltransferase [Capsulimonas corticalis]|uniref:Nicotinate-nucleotide--dimethylbenzimidazole phosphoribosyltransferase n=1 Tax=Capsulimonas corticalis TaxID=2219043 RepID=A0A402D172_9BACT|nr:nicotinate-nucleotide--dimethylbenzimidazole phosphoribosyltransferase [Capsulimonas corticalis]BDI31708.1 nicotinate-nucleotide--dimethylbenzimidazole phosphoribosyltransferase [Capsulimonas corticalis]
MTFLLSDIAASIPAFDVHAARQARERQDRLTKPQGSLGQLEALSIQLAGITGNPLPRTDRPGIFVFAADHGVAARGVSAYPAEVTAQMVLNYARGGAVINVLAKQIGAELTVADVGVSSALPDDLIIHHRKVRLGTADWTEGPAMTREEALRAIQIGAEIFEASGADLAVIGEMGIGNTTTAAALSAALTGLAPAELIGRGTGVDDAGLARKLAAIETGLARLPKTSDPLEILSAIGGLEIAAMAGVALAAARRRVPVLLDGFISTTAGLLAAAIAPAAREYLLASHRSPEPGHTLLLRRLELTPLLDLGMRLGEGSGAALAVPLIQSALAVLRDVATFEQAGVSDRE